MKIEDILLELKEQITIVLVTNLVQQARRIADRTAFLSGRAPDRGRPYGNDLRACDQPAHRAVRERRLRLMTTETAPPSACGGIETRNLSLWYGSFQALVGRVARDQAEPGHRADRALPDAARPRCCAHSTG